MTSRLIPVALLLLPQTTSAQLVTCGPGTAVEECTLDHLVGLGVGIYNFLMGMSAMVAFLFIVWGGVRMLYWTFMEDSARELEEAKYTVRRAIGGFLIILLAYLLVNTVLVILGVNEGSAVGRVLKNNLGFFK